MDKSNGYEAIATAFIEGRGRSVNGIGTTSVRNWARQLPLNSSVLDLGCGTGFPISKVLIDEGMSMYGVDASPTLIKVFRQNFPGIMAACEPVEDSSFFSRKFDAIIAWGLLFLMPGETQELVIRKVAKALQTGGRLLFTSPEMIVEWEDAMTGQLSLSLGALKYKELLTLSGLILVEEFEDEGENHYYHAVKTF